MFCSNCGNGVGAAVAVVPQEYASPFKVENAPNAEKLSFYRKTYLTTGFSFLVWIFTVYMLFSTEIAYTLLIEMEYVSWLLVLSIFLGALHIGRKLVFADEPKMQLLGLGIYIISYALIFVPLIDLVIYYSSDNIYYAMDNVFIPAFIATATIFAALTVTVFVTRTDFSFLRNFVIFGGFFANGALIIFTISGMHLGSWFAVAMIILMSGSILYSTHQIKEEFNTSQHIGAGAMLFSSFMVMLWYVIKLFLKKHD